MRNSEPTTIEGWLDLVFKHHEEHPDHGTDCACLDKPIAKIRLILSKYRVGTYTNNQQLTNQRRAVEYVLNSLTR